MTSIADGPEGAKPRARRMRRGRRPNGAGSIRMRPNGTYEGRIRLDGGAQQYVSAASWDEARAALDKLIREYQQGIQRSMGREPFGEYLTRWIEEADIAPSTRSRYRREARLRIIPALGHIQLDALTIRHVRAFVDRLRTTPHSRKHGGELLTANTIRQSHASVRAALNDAVRNETLTRNVAALVSPPTVRRLPPPILTATQARALLGVLSAHRLEAFYVLAVSVAMRESELIGLRWDAIDFANGRLVVRRQLQRVDKAWLPRETPKTASGFRTLVLSPPLVAVLERHRTRQEAERAAWIDPFDPALVFTSPIGQPLHARSVLGELTDRILPAAGLPRMTVHQLRHAGASLFLAAGVDPRTLMQILGHSQIGVTMNTYAHVLPALSQNASDAMARALFGDNEGKNEGGKPTAKTDGDQEACEGGGKVVLPAGLEPAT